MRKKWLFIVFFILLLIFFVACLFFGSADFSIYEVSSVFFSSDNEILKIIVLQKRLYEALTAVFAGAGLAVSGLFMQTLFRNPLADPSILGVSSGASLAMAIVMFCGSFFSLGVIISSAVEMLAAFSGSFMVLILLFMLSYKVRSNSALLVAGIMVGYLSSAVVTLLQFWGEKDSNYSFMMWSQGSFSRGGSSEFLIIFILFISVGLTAGLFLIKALNMLLLGENYAKNLGLNIKKTRFLIICLCTFIVGTITAYCGPIAFLGLAVPHIAKSMLKTANRRVLMPFSILLGAVIALFCLVFSKGTLFGTLIPINVITSLLGAPIVIYAIIKNKNAYI